MKPKGYNYLMLKRILIGLLIVFLGAFLIYYNTVSINPSQLKIREEIIRTDKSDEQLDKLMIAYFSDVRFNELDNRELFHKAVDTIADFKPDLIIFGGDMFSSHPSENDLDEVRTALSNINPRYGKYAVLGELDLKYRETMEELYSDTGFRILDNDNVQIGLGSRSFLNIVGLNLGHDYQSCFSGLNSSYFTMAICHYPDRFDDIENYAFDYMLSGHSLGMQLNIPLIRLFNRNEGFEKYAHGKTIRNGHTLDISNGVGMAERKARFNSDAEVVFYRFSS